MHRFYNNLEFCTARKNWKVKNFVNNWIPLKIIKKVPDKTRIWTRVEHKFGDEWIEFKKSTKNRLFWIDAQIIRCTRMSFLNSFSEIKKLKILTKNMRGQISKSTGRKLLKTYQQKDLDERSPISLSMRPKSA